MQSEINHFKRFPNKKEEVCGLSSVLQLFYYLEALSGAGATSRQILISFINNG